MTRHLSTFDHHRSDTPYQRFNRWLAERVTGLVGTMTCAYLFAGLALLSLPNAIRGGTPTLISWIAQTFIQLVLLSVIMVAQNLQSAAADARAAKTFDDVEAINAKLDQLVAKPRSRARG